MSYLLSISIGPVQDFISTARRSRDLWLGSWLLSELSKAVAKEIGGKNLIFPAISDDAQLEENSKFSVVNKILAIVEHPQEVEINCRNAIRKRLEKIYQEVFDEIDRKLQKNGKIFYRAEAEAQIKDMVEFYWAAYPYDKNNYAECRERVEILLNARKSTRNFATATPWASNAPKSSLDGQRESVIEDAKIDDPEIQRIFALRRKERLCGVGLLKRLGAKGTDDRFFSTSHVASLPLLDSVKDKRVSEFDYIRDLTGISGEIEESEFKKIVGKTPIAHDFFANYDGHLLFEERLTDFFEGDRLKEAGKALKQFMKNAFDDENIKPVPYYALLLADGDRMGTVIDKQENEDDHKELSKVLSDFAQEAKTIVEKKESRGSLIYAGGDDVLALLPLHTVLDCARQLADEFNKKLSANPKFVDRNGNPPTLSVGIAIAHHIEPLQDALTKMRDAEKEAKKVNGKNALAIVLSKRSGADRIIKGSWKDDRKTGRSFAERLKWFVQLHLDDALPDGAAYEIRDLWLRFKNVSELEEPMKAEAVRILRRKRSNQGLSKVSQDILDKIELLITSKEFSLKDLANEIIVARDFARAYKQAKKSAINKERDELTNLDN